MILAFIDSGAEPPIAEDTPTPQGGVRRKSSRRESRRGSADGVFLGMDVVRAGGENRPVRRGLSREKRKAMTVAGKAAPEEDDVDWVPIKAR
eukprot:2474697-Pleurochrysis_carterae.AAC.1